MQSDAYAGRVSSVGKRIIRTTRVTEKMGWSRTTLWRWVRFGDVSTSHPSRTEHEWLVGGDH